MRPGPTVTLNNFTCRQINVVDAVAVSYCLAATITAGQQQVPVDLIQLELAPAELFYRRQPRLLAAQSVNWHMAISRSLNSDSATPQCIYVLRACCNWHLIELYNHRLQCNRLRVDRLLWPSCFPLTNGSALEEIFTSTNSFVNY